MLTICLFLINYKKDKTVKLNSAISKKYLKLSINICESAHLGTVYFTENKLQDI
jgi:hypothetical protein